MMAITGWYYLHTNGDLIYKKELGETAADLRESDFVRMQWPFDATDREGAWRILIEATAAGAASDRVDALTKKWGCTDKDAATFAEVVGFDLVRDGDMYCARRRDFVNLQESPAGFGATALSAMVELAKDLGWVPEKMWGPTFQQIVRADMADGRRSQ